MSNILKIAGAGVSAAAEETDANFNQTVLLLHGDGTNGAQNNTFLDSSTNNFTVTRNGNTTQGTFSPFSVGAGEWSNYFGASNYLTCSSTSISDFGTSAFTFECWVYVENLNPHSGSSSYIYDGRPAGNGAYFTVGISSTGKVNLISNGTSIILSTNAITANSWNHIVVVRNSTSANESAIFINGTRSDTFTFNVNVSNPNNVIGAARYLTLGSLNLYGYISNMRITKGADIYGYSNSTITVPTAPLTTSVPSGTVSLLTCQDNRFVDETGKTLVVAGTPKVTPFSPFAPTAAYSASVNGGSGYFDGTGDNLTFTGTSSTVGSGDFTIECWYYPTAFQDYDTLFGNTRGATGFNFGTNASASVTWYSSSAAQITSGALQLNAWNHIAFTRTSNTLRLYVNGAQTGSTPTVSTDFSATGYVIGDLAPLPSSEPANGYITGLRVVKESLASGSTYTIPTAPYQASDNANTSLLLNFTNAGIFDNTGKNNLETVGNAQIDTTTKKYGTGSMEFDGTGDYLLMPKSENFAFGTGDFTVEFWWNPSTLATVQILIYNTDDGGAAGTGEYAFIYNTTLGLRFYLNSGAVDINQGATTGWSTGQFYHIAMVRNGNTLTLYRDGTSIASGSVSGATIGSASVPFYIGGDIFSSLYATGFIDDLRITKGVARYTTGFTPPTKEFPNL